jgi:hypothetical protein
VPLTHSGAPSAGSLRWGLRERTRLATRNQEREGAHVEQRADEAWDRTGLGCRRRADDAGVNLVSAMYHEGPEYGSCDVCGAPESLLTREEIRHGTNVREFTCDAHARRSSPSGPRQPWTSSRAPAHTRDGRGILPPPWGALTPEPLVLRPAASGGAAQPVSFAQHMADLYRF